MSRGLGLLSVVVASVATAVACQMPSAMDRDGSDPSASLAGQLTVSAEMESDHRADLLDIDLGDGAVLRRRTVRGDDYSPAWSPDGTKLAFTRRTRGSFDIFMMRGRATRRLTRTAGDEHSMAWDPAGKRLVYGFTPAGKDYVERSDLMVLNVRTGNRRVLLRDVRALDPDWSPDGRSIAYVSQRDFHVWTVSRRGDERRRIAQGPGVKADPHWDPSSSRIAVRLMGRSGAFTKVALIEVDGGSPMTVVYRTNDPLDRIGAIDWSPDGAWIALAQERNGSLLRVIPLSGDGGPVTVRREDRYEYNSISWRR